MEAFQVLTRGGAFDKKRFKTDVQLFNVSAYLSGHPITLDLPSNSPQNRRRPKGNLLKRLLKASCLRSSISSSTPKAIPTSGKR